MITVHDDGNIDVLIASLNIIFIIAHPWPSLEECIVARVLSLLGISVLHAIVTAVSEHADDIYGDIL